MGLLDLPSPFFQAVDLLMQNIPASVRIVVWAVVGAAVSMWLYKLLSPQQELERVEAQARDARMKLNAFDGDMDKAGPLIANALGKAMRRLWLAFPPALVASLPLLVLVAWLSNQYGYRFHESPPQTAVAVEPGTYQATMVRPAAVADTGSDRHVVVREPQGRMILDVPVRAPVPVIEKWQWWNWLLGNPAGYLPDASPVTRVDLSLPRQNVISVGPSWMRGWEFSFFVLLFAFSLIFKKAGRIA
ncbi:hypothetical protein FHS78_002677 [Parvibaculum indicum]|uniref:hypothetical protein n=1 Tax=Parvibaculum indicum TaxID=562969 RepID=UPI001421929B|nr:hypothetical protein [Parvibaculum indicum]NIJ42383.1 hypothetical protein [Parvibaculum indicum]